MKEPLHILISGANGHMGRTVAKLASDDPMLCVAAGFDVSPAAEPGEFPIYAAFGDYKPLGSEKEVLVDFSSPAALETGLLEFCIANKIPAVLCTTGYSERHLEGIRRASERIPIFKAANFSAGIQLLLKLVAEASAVLGSDFDAEILETHHRRKVDAPSGTALLLADALGRGRNYVTDRSTRREPRHNDEVGISAIRGGTIPGEHTVIFAGSDEVIEIKHSIYSRDVFAAGALRAAKFLAEVKSSGLYDSY
ncbi:MAG: 4-hydroxy-tetrahydrodipicolinate reductase [Oscillospiraceae bacterium]|jgi:4-hydroxy-tetrahydrodipicolinate reductase|nr:4-hydroxy-tetrahydrodipicolinate reductase [Oscillospiraceae bacterium]